MANYITLFVLILLATAELFVEAREKAGRNGNELSRRRQLNPGALDFPINVDAVEAQKSIGVQNRATKTYDFDDMEPPDLNRPNNIPDGPGPAVDNRLMNRLLQPHQHDTNGIDDQFQSEVPKILHPALSPAGLGRLLGQQQLQRQQQRLRMTTTSKRRKLTEPREAALRKLINLGQVVLYDEQENSDFLARYGLSQDYKLRYSPPPLSDPWPLPQVFEESGHLYAVNPNELDWNLLGKGSACPTLGEIIDRYKTDTLFVSAGTLAADDAVLDPGLLYMPADQQQSNANDRPTATLPNRGPRGQKLHAKTRFWVQDEQHPIETINVNLVSNCTDWPTRDSDETYSLSVNSNGISITANEIWGILYALETLSQLIHYNGVSYIVRGVSILDWPRFRHRGMMLDTSRHFLPKAILKHNIDALVQNKLNVFHWHLSDDHSFPLHLNSFPNFARKAAFSPQQIYSHQDVREIIEYARVRGVRVMPEIDTPSHVFSWRHLPVDILTRCYSSDGLPTGDVGPLDPTINRTYEVVEKILKEVGQLFPDRSFHAGGDEVPLTCWATHPEIDEFRTKNKHLSPLPNMPELRVEDLVTLYNQRLLSIIRDMRSQEDPTHPIMWEEAFRNDWNLSKNVTLHVWLSDQNLVKFLADGGYQVLFSQCWYLNYISYGVDWIKYYRCDPTKIGEYVLIQNDQNVAGGEVCLWGEYIDETNLMSTLWPRASAVAERLWSNITVTDIDYAGRRLEEHRCRMLRRGIAAAPVSGPGTCGDLGYRPSHVLRDYEMYRPSPNNPVSYNLSNTIAMCQRLLADHQQQSDNHFYQSFKIHYAVQGNFLFSVESVLQLCLIAFVIIGGLLMCRGRRMGHGLKVFRPVIQRISVLLPKKATSSTSPAGHASVSSVPSDKVKP